MGNTISPCFVGFYDAEGEEEAAADSLLQCHQRAIALLKSQLSQAQAEIAALRRCVEAAGKLRAIADSEGMDEAVVEFDAARAAVGKGTT